MRKETMFASRITVSEETLKQNQLSKRERGKLRYQRLVELDKSGEISRATTRNELAVMLGYPDKDKTGISWVNNLVNRGYLTERLVGRDGTHLQKEFHITSKRPDYDFKQLKASNKKMRAEKKAKEIMVAEEIERREKEASLTITKGDITITATLEAGDIVRVITNII